MEDNYQSRQPLVRISKDGQMRLKNKVAVAILRENTYEERALKSKLKQIQSYRKRQEQTLTHRQLEFATARITEIEKEEKRPHTMAGRLFEAEGGLVHSHEHLPRLQSRTNLAGNQSEQKETSPKAKWERAINLVRSAVSQPRDQSTKPSESHSNRADQKKDWKFITEEKSNKESDTKLVLPAPKSDVRIDKQVASFTELQSVNISQNKRDQFCTQDNPISKTRLVLSQNTERKEHLPPVVISTEQTIATNAPIRASRRRKHRDKYVSLPELLQVSREKSLIGIKDPRFKKLESCLVMKPSSLQGQVPDDDFLAFTRKKEARERKTAGKKFKSLTLALPRETQAATPLSAKSYSS